MSLAFCHMHGPEHHVMVGAALLTAYRNAGGQLDLPRALQEMLHRGKQVPGGACGYWGACGAGLSTGMFVSIATGSTPLAKEAWGLSNRMTGLALLPSNRPLCSFFDYTTLKTKKKEQLPKRQLLYKLEFDYICVIFFISSTISLITPDIFFLNILSNNL
jgi:hypothetical protein